MPERKQVHYSVTSVDPRETLILNDMSTVYSVFSLPTSMLLDTVRC